MAKESFRKPINRLLTARRNYYVGGGPLYGITTQISSQINPPTRVNPPSGATETEALAEMRKRANNMQISPPATTASIPDNAQIKIPESSDTSTASSTNWGGIAALAGAAASDIAGMISNIGGADTTQYEDAIKASMKTPQAASYDDLSNYWKNTTFGKKITAKQLGAKSATGILGNFLTQSAEGGAAGASLGPWGALGGAVGGGATALIGDLLGNAKRKKQALKLNQELAMADTYKAAGLIGQAMNIGKMNDRNSIRNISAFGGPIDISGAIDYELANRYLDAKNAQAMGYNKSVTSLPNSFMDNIKSLAYGGYTHGSNFTNGLIYVGNGGSHESNPFEGVPMGVDNEGVPNLVEEGEVIFNDYVFSNRLRVPKEVRKKYKLRGTKPLTFAEAATQMSKESEERPNDPISKAGLEDSMMKLMIAQEQVRAKREKNRFAKGGKMGRKYWDGSLLDRPIDMNDTSWMEGLDLTDEDVTQSDWWKENIAPLAGPIDPSTTVASIGDSTAYPSAEAVPSTTKETLGKPKTPKTKTISDNTDNSLAPTWMRYVPAFASGIMSVTDALGLTNKPDYSEADMVLDAARGAATYSPVGFSPIGNYLGYTPFDREFYINQMNAQAGATRRAIIQNAGLNRGAGMAALLASDYNTQGQFGQLARQAEEYNLAQRQKVEEFNKATDMFNTEGALKADMANQEALLKTRDAYLKGTLSAAELRQRERQQSAAARSANLSNFINSLGDIGRENFARNMIISDPSKYYTIGANGQVTYKNGFDSLSDAEKRQVRGHAAEHGGTSFARGGFLTRRKRRR